MADFIDNEASEASTSEEEEDDDDDDFQTRSKKSTKGRAKKKKKTREVIDSSEEDDEDDEMDEEEMKDLINDEEEEDGDDQSSDEEGAGTKRSHGDGDDDEGSSSLEDDDLDLIQENLGVRIEKKKRFKRIKTFSEEDSEEEADEGKKIQNELFGPTDGLLESDDEEVNKPRRSAPQQDLDLEIGDDESDSDDNFIVDDNDQPIHKKTKKKGARYTDSAMQQAQEVFGVDFDFDEVEDDDGYDDQEGYEDDYDEDDETGESRPRKKKGGRKSIYEVYEPAELERSHMTNFDQKVRSKDEPERFQLRPTPVTSANEHELVQEAEWIFKSAFDEPTISIQERNNEPVAGKRSEVIKTEIEYALKCIRNEKLEVPFIAAYRREYVPSISSNFDDTKDLWTIYNFDEQWCKIQSAKKNISKLYTDMRDYIKTLGAEARDKIRPILDTDFERVDYVRTFHDVEDCRKHFQLYYSRLVPEMKLQSLAKVIEEQRSSKAQNNQQKERDDDEVEDEEQENPKEEAEPEETEEEKLFKRLSKFKISSNRDNYQKCRQEGLGGLVQKFGLTPEQFGENLRDDYQRNNVSQHYTKPIDQASNFITKQFSTREAALKAATFMFSKEISCDPLVRRTVRKYYFDNAVINVKPTIMGMKEIDENHPCYSFKYLKNKPVSRLVGDQFIHITNGEKDKLLEVKFSIEAIVEDNENRRSTISPYYESLKALYYSDFSSIVTKEWNDTREEGIRAAMDKYILPCIEQQLRQKLMQESQSKIIKTCREKLHHWLNVAPYAPSSAFDDHEEFELRNGTRICGFTFDPDGEAPCFAAIVDAEGELIDHVRLPYFHFRKRIDRLNATERENRAKDIAKFKQFMINKKPHAVALAAETIQTKYICQDLAQILDELREHDDLPLIPIEIVDNELSNVYMNLKRATEEFNDFPPLLLQAISNARKLNDPLGEYSKLCGPDNDILCLRFHSLQDDLPKDVLLTNLYQQFITVTNSVGVDPNRAIAHPHTSNLVQFVSGLGPRKGAHLLRSIKKLSTNGQLVSRQQLIKELGMTSVIFINSAGFIKLDTDSLVDYYPDEPITALDSTRIHPESYGLAKKIASDALDYEQGASEEVTANSIEEILDCPEKLDDLDLGAFARELDEVQNQGKKGFTLQSIREEFQCRYKDNREFYKAPSQEEIFAMLTKETPNTFYIGKLITCQVFMIPRKKPSPAQLDMTHPAQIEGTSFWRCTFCMRSDFQDLGHVWNHFDTGECPGYAIGVKCKLDNGLFGFVPTKLLSDKEISDPSERVMIGQTIHARIIKIDTEKFSCDLTCRTSDLVDEDCKLKPQKDEHYDEAMEKKTKMELEAKSKRTVRRPYCKRVIVHPAFQNIDYKACEKKLQDMEQGQAIIRPSSAGQDYLTISWKITDGIHQHINIKEEGKDNAFSLGHQLFIDNESYEDLDEIIARYIQPLASYAREILNHKYCIPLPPDAGDEVDLLQERLVKEKLNAPNSFPYRFCPSRKMPGKFIFGYMPKHKPKIEYLTVTPKGYRFRKLYFKNLLGMIKWFKENWNKMPQIYPSITPGMGYEAATNPMASLRGTFPMSQ